MTASLPSGSPAPATGSPAPLLRLSGPFTVGMIWAQARGGVIGAEGTLAWHLPEDLAHFKATTHGFAVLHGRRSYEALPDAVRPLPGRKNFVLTRQRDYAAPGAHPIASMDQLLTALSGEPVWVCGGGEVYRIAMPFADVLVVTDLDADVAGDTYAPSIDSAWRVQQRTPWQTSRTGIRFRITEYRPARG